MFLVKRYFWKLSKSAFSLEERLLSLMGCKAAEVQKCTPHECTNTDMREVSLYILDVRSCVPVFKGVKCLCCSNAHHATKNIIQACQTE